MILRDSIRINAPPERVWQYLEDPERMQLWNPKIKAVVSVSWGQRCKGFRYRLTYVLGGKESEVSAEIEEYQPPTKLVIRHTGGRLPPGQRICWAPRTSRATPELAEPAPYESGAKSTTIRLNASFQAAAS